MTDPDRLEAAAKAATSAWTLDGEAAVVLRASDVLAMIKELRRLREAVEQIVNSEPAFGTWDGWREVHRLRDIARAALREPK
jgi:hypothetical protein